MFLKETRGRFRSVFTLVSMWLFAWGGQRKLKGER